MMTSSSGKYQNQKGLLCIYVENLNDHFAVYTDGQKEWIPKLQLCIDTNGHHCIDDNCVFIKQL